MIDRVSIQSTRETLIEWVVDLLRRSILDSGKYVKSVSRRVVCKIPHVQRSPVCAKDDAFRENTDTKLTNKWNQLLSSIPILSEAERLEMRSRVTKEGIHEIYRQTSRLYDDYIQVRDFRHELEKKYGRDIRSRKGNEIIFTTEQLLESRKSCDATLSRSHSDDLVQCSLHNRSTTNGVFN